MLVDDIFSAPLPAKSFLVVFLFRENKGFHAPIESGVRLYKVSYVELVLSESASVLNFKVKPLGEVRCVVISLQN